MRRLYHFPLSTDCRYIRLILAEKRLTTELVHTQPWERNPELLRLNPSGNTPVMLEEGGQAIVEAYAISELLEETYTATPLLPLDQYERAEARRLIDWFNTKFRVEVTQNLLDERLIKRLSGKGEPNSSRVRAGVANMGLHLDYIGWLTERRRWLAGGSVSLADFAAAAHLSTLDYIGSVPWEQAPEAKAWYARIKSRPAFRGILADHLTAAPPVKWYADLDF